MATETKTVFLHVGCRKSGTTAVQLGFRKAAKRLRADGLEQPLGARGGTMSGLRDPVLETLRTGDPAPAEEAVARLASLVRESDAPRHLVSLEALAEMPAEATSIIVGGLAEFEVHLVITARPWALTIPSEWQQLVKSRFTSDYLEFAEAVHDPSSVEGALAEEGARFRHRQDLADVVRRWRAAAPALPVHVILVPPRDVTPGITEMFCSVVGVDPARIPTVDRVVNPSISHENAEVLRLVNQALGTRLENTRSNYRYSVRKWIAVGSMMKGSPGARIRLPGHLDAWAFAESQRQLDEIRELGCEVLGDPDSYVTPRLGGEDVAVPSDAAVAQAAAEVLADLASWHHQQRRDQRARQRRRRAAKKRRRLAAQQPPVGAVPGARGRVTSALRRRLGRVRARLRR